MASARLINVLTFIRNNVMEGVETLEEVRRLARPSTGLTDEECLFLEAALKDEKRLEAFYQRFVVGAACEQPHGRVGATGHAARSAQPGAG